MESEEIKTSVKEWANKLLSGDEILVKNTISELREKGSKEVIPILGKLLHSNPSEDIAQSIISFLRDLKNKESVPYLVEIIKESKDLEILPPLIACAWENGLDYSEHIEFFIDIVVEEGLLASIEAFTVVEENIEKINASKRNEFIKNIAKKTKSVSKDKAQLIEELMSIINIAPGPFSFDKTE